MDHIGEEARRFADDAEWIGALIVELRRALRRANERTQASSAVAGSERGVGSEPGAGSEPEPGAGSVPVTDSEPVTAATGTRTGHHPHTHSEQEVLRFIAAQPGVGTNAIAAALRLSSNTVSSLLSSLVAEGAVRREIDPNDRRKARFLLGEGQENIRAAKADRRSESVSLAMQHMDPQARSDLHAALPALAQLVARLDDLGAEGS